MTGFPRQHARTRRFSLGIPRGFVSGVGPTGPVVLFLRSDTGDDPVTHLWLHDPRDGATRKIVDARALGSDGDVPVEERARRERAREQAGGIVSFAVDAGMRIVTFSLAGRLHTVDLASGTVTVHDTAGPAFDPQPSPDARRIAYHASDALHVLDLPEDRVGPGRSRELAAEAGVVFGRAEFVAAEEMGRGRAMWWSGDGGSLAVTRVDEAAVVVWTLADPANPWTEPVSHRYPAAGTQNADVSVWIIDAGTGDRTEVRWDRERDEYLAHVAWGDGPLTLLVQPRDQTAARVLSVDPSTGTTTLVRQWTDPAWVELVPGVPRWCGESLVTVEDRAERGDGGTRTLCWDAVPVTPPGLQVRAVLAVHRLPGVPDGGTVTFTASAEGAPTCVGPYCVHHDPQRGDTLVDLAPGGAPGLRDLVVPRAPSGASPATVPGAEVHIERTLESAAPRITVVWSGERAAGSPDAPLPATVVRHALLAVAEQPVVTARPRMLVVGQRKLRAALFLPEQEHDPGGSLPVLLDPYGGPHAQRVVHAQAAHLTSQWLADQGFAVLVVDGRGSPGRGPAWERAVHRDLATHALDDQIDALEAVAAGEPRLDFRRVGIRGWSFGGYLAALAVLRRPDVFRAAIAGAPVTDWRLYDTHYTERYLGHPDEHPEAYHVSSLVDTDGRLLGAADWDGDSTPALMLIHGLADDNVVAAHSLRLSAALLAEGRRHDFLPLSGVTHMTPQEEVAEHLLHTQVAFLRDHLH